MFTGKQYRDVRAIENFSQFFAWGNLWFVNSATGTDDTAHGYTPQAPFATLAYALSSGLVTASNGDVIVVAPTHAETLTTAGQIAVSTAGVRIVGLGTGRKRPTFTFGTSVAASLNFSAANCTLENCILAIGIDNLTAMINITAADVWIQNCEFQFCDGTNGAALCILTAATADRLAVQSCRFLGPAVNAGTTLAAAIQHEAGVDYQITDNFMCGKATQMIKNVATVLRGRIHNNVMVVGTGTAAITMAAASTPMITNNRMNVASGTAPIVSAAGFMAGNVYSAAAGVTAGTASTF